jgi:hypothetical protein
VTPIHCCRVWRSGMCRPGSGPRPIHPSVPAMR